MTQPATHQPANLPASQSTNPYVGPRTFTEKEQRYFFGREREARDLTALIVSERLLLFYAQSGAGKSSLLNARVIPRLRDEERFQVLPVGRVSGELPAGVAEVANIYAFNLMTSLDQSGEHPQRLAQVTLSEFLARLARQTTVDAEGQRTARWVYKPEIAVKQPAEGVAQPAASGSRFALVIDQFEEIITSHPGRWQQREGFFRQLNQALLDDPNLWVVLSLREDYVASLDPHAELLFNRLRARFYMERMGVASALEAVRRPAELGGRPFASRVAEHLVEDLRQVRVSGQEATVAGPTVEPVQLQVVCHQLWQNIENEQRPLGPITTQDVLKAGDVNKALINFYEEVLASTLRDFAEQITERRLRTWFEQELITPDGTRGLVRQGEEATGDLANSVVAAIQKRFLLRSDTRSGDTRIELVHDRFVEPILASNRQWRAQNQNPLVLAAEVWLAEDRSPRRLLYGAQLRAAETQLDAARHELTEDERSKIMALLDASASQERQRSELLLAQKMALLEPQKYISEMGWGVIFPAVPRDDPAQQEIDAIKEALQPLLDHRKAEATLRDQALYREFIHGNGCRPGDTAHNFLARHGVGPGKVEPSLMPYYLLLVGGPEAIPFEFQYQLDVQYAVGRIEFDTPEDYRRYAESVVQAETGTSVRPQRVALFAPRHTYDQAMDLLHSGLIKPLAARLEAAKPDWPLTLALEEYATKARLGQLLGGDETPALAFIAGRGMEFPVDNPRQLGHQGALLCQDWPGPPWKGALTEDFYFAADDLSSAANLLGLIAFVFANCGAGTPRFDDFFRQDSQTSPRIIAERAFVARLPQRLLSHPQGGALAFVSHVERNWGYSFIWDHSFKTGVRTYAAVIERLLEGYPVGAAVEVFNQRYAELATVLSATLNRIDQGETIDQFELANLWTATIDARNWVVIGDPAVRLMVSGLRPDTAGLRLLYQVENLRREGDRLAEAGDLEGAEGKYQRVAELNPWLGIDPAVEARSVAARTWLRSAKQMAAKGLLEEAVARLEQAQQLNPDLGLATIKEVGLLLAPYFLKKGREAARAGSYERALELLGQAAQFDPILGVDASAEARRGVAQYHVEEGRRLAQAGNAAEAITQYEKACAFDPTLKSEFDPTQDLQPKLEAGKYAARFFQEQGDKLAEQGDRAQAAAAFRQAVELDPTLEKEWEPEARAAQLVAKYQKARARAATKRSKPEKSSQTPESAQWLWFNGVNAATGEYATPPLTAEDLVRLVRGEASRDSLQEQLGQRLATSSGDSLLRHL